MQKKLSFLVVFAFAFLQNCAADCAFVPMFQVLQRTPVIVCGTLKNIQSPDGQTTAQLVIETVFKGAITPQTIDISLENARRMSPGFENNVKKVYFISQNQDKTWKMQPGYCAVNQLSVNNKQEVEIFDQKLATFDDFKEGLLLLAKNYEGLHNYSKQDVPNPTKNRTFGYLIDQIRGQIAPNPPAVTKNTPSNRPAVDKIAPTHSTVSEQSSVKSPLNTTSVPKKNRKKRRK